MEKRDFIITSSQAWDIAIGSTIKSTALEIAKKNRVLFVSTPLDIASRVRNALSSKKNNTYEFRRRMDVLEGKASPLRKINENLWILDCHFTVVNPIKEIE